MDKTTVNLTTASIDVDKFNGTLSAKERGLLTVYSDDEKAAINALTDADDDTYYLFLVNSVTKLDADGNRTIVSGYMPVGYRHGFIFEQFDVARTIAHELSHGAFAYTTPSQPTQRASMPAKAPPTTLWTTPNMAQRNGKLICEPR